MSTGENIDNTTGPNPQEDLCQRCGLYPCYGLGPICKQCIKEERWEEGVEQGDYEGND